MRKQSAPAEDDAEPCTNELAPIILSVWELLSPLRGSLILSGNIKAPDKVTAAPIAPVDKCVSVNVCVRVNVCVCKSRWVGE